MNLLKNSKIYYLSVKKIQKNNHSDIKNWVDCRLFFVFFFFATSDKHSIFTLIFLICSVI